MTQQSIMTQRLITALRSRGLAVDFDEANNILEEINLNSDLDFSKEGEDLS